MDGIWIGVAAATLCLAGEACAEEPASASPEPARLAAGLAVLSADRGYRGEATRARLVPALHLRADRFELVGERATLRLAGDAACLVGMSTRRSSWMVGVTAEWRGTWGIARTELERSMSASRGARVTLPEDRGLLLPSCCA